MLELAANGLVNVNTIKFLRGVLSAKGLEKFLNKTGFPVDIQNQVEAIIYALPVAGNYELSGLVKWIKNNPTEFFYAEDIESLTRKINNDLLLDPYYINFLGWSFPIYSDPYHLRMYTTYAAIGLGLYWLLKKR